MGKRGAKKKTERDAQMFREYQEGASVASLAEKYEVAGETVYNVLRRVSRETGEKLLKKIHTQNTKAERNAALVREYQEGVDLEVLIKKYDITKQRIYQIVERELKGVDEKRVDRSRVPKKHPMKKEVDTAIIEKVVSGEISSLEAARRAGVCSQVIQKRVKDISGYSIMEMKVDEAEARSELFYKEFMAGVLLKDLSEKYGMTQGSMYQKILRYRKKHNLPLKCAFLQPKKS